MLEAFTILAALMFSGVVLKNMTVISTSFGTEVLLKRFCTNKCLTWGPHKWCKTSGVLPLVGGVIGHEMSGFVWLWFFEFMVA